MKKKNLLFCVILFGIGLFLTQCLHDEIYDDPLEATLKSKKVVEADTEAGNCLSFPVIWAEGETKTLRGNAGADPVINGEWWYWWGIEGDDPNNTVISSGRPDPDNNDYIDDNNEGTFNESKVPGEGWLKVFLQKDEDNIWQAENENGDPNGVVIDLIDWGDNLESVPWYLSSHIRTEVVLYKENIHPPMLQYEMRHVSGWGINEVHGLAVSGGNHPITVQSSTATVYSACARLTIQRLIRSRTQIEEGTLVWQPEYGWTEQDPTGENIINPPIFNKSVAEVGDGPGYYAAEINVKGMVVYGYTWNVRTLNEGAGDYRITFSFDQNGANGINLNTFFEEGSTEIFIPVEIEDQVVATDETEHGGGVAKIDFANNLTFIDIHIDEVKGRNPN